MGADFIVIQIGWSDEQIEGWKIMLERNVSFLAIFYFLYLVGLTVCPIRQPKKDKILQKHEFTGNQPLQGPVEGPSSAGRGRGRGRGGGQGRGGRGGQTGQGQGRGGGSGGSAKERAWKDKNKASRGNHNRKRRHDKKMAGAGGPPVG